MATTTFERPASVLDRPIWTTLALNWEKVLYLALIGAAFVTRFYDLGARVMSHDESLHTQWSWYLYQGRGFQHSPLMHGPLKFEVTAFTYWLLGDNDFTSRLPTALTGVAAVGLMYFFRKWLGRTGALVGALLMLISPYMLYYSRYIRDEPIVVMWGMLMVLCVLNFLETRAAKYLYWLTAITALFYATMETSFIYIAITMLFLGLHLVRELFAATWPRAEFRRPFELSFVVTLVALALAGGFFFYNDRVGVLSGAETAAPANPDTAESENPCQVSATGQSDTPFLQLALWSGVVGVGGLAAGTYFVFRSFGKDVRRFPALDLLVIFGVFVLPQLTAFPVRALCRNPLTYTLPATQGMPLGDRLLVFFTSDAGVTVTIALVLAALSLAVGWLWHWRRFLISAGIFYGIYLTLFTTFFTNGAGLATGVIGSLGYWLVQQGVRRGNQPWYYYPAVNLPLYEFLPALGALFALGLWLVRWMRAERPTAEDAQAPAHGLKFPVIGFFGFWAVMALIGFSIAGEKMPWLTTHLTLPLILLSGWSIGQFIDGTDWHIFRERRAWLLALLLPVTLLALASAFGSLLGANPPFRGSELAQLEATGAFVSAALVSAIGVAGLRRLAPDLGWRNVGRLAVLSVFGLLALLTARTAFIAAYVNYDFANEYLVYAHGARGVKTVMAQIDDISARTTDGVNLKVAYDSDVAWPMTWYLREYDKNNYAFYGEQPTRDKLDAPVVIAGPKHWNRVEALLGDRYYKFDYIRMVWPMQEYFNLNWDRIRGALGNRDYRQALWNIWFSRDYTLYGQLTNTNYDLSQWPVAERMHFYVRKDVAAQIWSYGVGPTLLSGSGAEEDPYVASRQVLAASTVWGSQGPAVGSFEAPRAVAVAPDGSVYVADSRNHRIQKFDADGNPLLSWGSFGVVRDNTGAPGTFNEPWGVAVGPDGSVYVADTWNHRIQKFDANGQFITMWGQEEFQATGFEGFWGPRAVAVDAAGRVFVADTGNKRIVVYDQNGAGLTTIGAGGFEAGFLDEPVGLALSPDGALYVADTWNQRVQVFRPETATGEYVFSAEWRIVGWYGQSLENKPYLALDPQGRVYVTDPEGYRVLVFDAAGNFITTWGDFGSDATTFTLVSGVAVNADGEVYVTDSGGHRVLRFPPLADQPT